MMALMMLMIVLFVRRQLTSLKHTGPGMVSSQLLERHR
jgi:hypothetical protein